MQNRLRWHRAADVPAGTPTAVTVRASPRGTGRLSEGAAVKASITARLLGLRLLTIDATIVIAPAETVPTPAIAPAPLANELVLGARPVGDDLTAAARFLQEGAESLAAAEASDRRPV